MDCSLVASLLTQGSLESLEETESEELAQHVHTCKKCSHLFRERQKRRTDTWVKTHMPLFLCYTRQVEDFISERSEAGALMRRANYLRPSEDRIRRFPVEVAYEVVLHRICDHSAMAPTLSEADITATIEDLLSEWVRGGHV